MTTVIPNFVILYFKDQLPKEMTINLDQLDRAKCLHALLSSKLLPI